MLKVSFRAGTGMKQSVWEHGDTVLFGGTVETASWSAISCSETTCPELCTLRGPLVSTPSFECVGLWWALLLQMLATGESLGSWESRNLTWLQGMVLWLGFLWEHLRWLWFPEV